MCSDKVFKRDDLAIIRSDHKELSVHDLELHRASLEEVLTNAEALEAGCIRGLTQPKLLVHFIFLKFNG